jgi:hypothetical protein
VRTLPILIPKPYLMGASTHAYVQDGDDLTERLVDVVLESIDTDLQVEVAGVRMFLGPGAARSEEERRRMQKRGGAWSPKKEARERAEREQLPVPTPKEFALTTFRLIKRLLDARLDGAWPPEGDFRRQALGAYLASCVYTLPDDDRARYAYALVSRDLRDRDDITASAESELRAVIDELAPEERDLALQIAS